MLGFWAGGVIRGAGLFIKCQLMERSNGNMLTNSISMLRRFDNLKEIIRKVLLDGDLRKGITMQFRIQLFLLVNLRWMIRVNKSGNFRKIIFKTTKATIVTSTFSKQAKSLKNSLLHPIQHAKAPKPPTFLCPQRQNRL